MLGYKLIEINKGYGDIESGIVIRRLNNLSGQEFFDWFKSSLANFQNFARLFTKCLDELIVSFGPPGTAAKPIEIKNAIERFIQLSRELLNWEYELESINPPEELREVKEILNGSTKEMFIDELKDCIRQLKNLLKRQESNQAVLLI